MTGNRGGLMKSEYEKGFLAAIMCTGLWGVLPLYWKSLIPIPSSVIISYRILLVAIVSLVFARLKYSWHEILSPLKDKKIVCKYVITGLIITSNWSIFIWAVNSGHIIQTSIGYYIEPLAVCTMGIIFFKERLTFCKLIAIGLASLSVIIILIHYRQIPGIALLLAITFATYSAIKKTVKYPPVLSLFYETIFLAPFAFIYIVYMELHGTGAIGRGAFYHYMLLLLCGFATAIPLGLFAYAAQRTTMFVLGLAEYISPTITLIIGVLIYKEPADRILFMAIGVIWLGLIFFSYGEFKDSKNRK